MYTIQLLHTKKHTYTKPALCRMYCIHKWLHLVLQQIDFPLLKHFKIPIMLKCCALCICVNYCTVRRYKIICTFFNLLHYTYSTHSTQYTLWSLTVLTVHCAFLFTQTRIELMHNNYSRCANLSWELEKGIFKGIFSN